MNIQPGDRIGIEKDGVIYSDTVSSISYTSPTPAMYRRLSWWQKAVRRMTPLRLRKPLQVRAADLGRVTINIGSDDDALERMRARITEIDKSLRDQGFHNE
jgi:hypothetical protein